MDRTTDKPSIERLQLADRASTYWVIECLLNNKIVYWTGNIPHLSIQQSEAGLPMWTPNIHESHKMKTKEHADRYNYGFEVFGDVTEHMDVEHFC